MSLHALLADIKRREGGLIYTNDPDDSGGPTFCGITLASYAEYKGRAATVDELKALTEAEVDAFYLHRHWKAPGFQAIAAIDQDIAEELADTGVNMGPGTATTFLQRFLSAFNDRQRLWPDLKPDGVAGAKTRAALSAYLHYRRREGKEVLLFCLNAIQAVRYLQIAEKREKDERFVYGQILNRAAAPWLDRRTT